jgi:hypothetical protein
MRSIMLALTAAFIFTGTMATITTARADSTTVIRHGDGDKTVVKKHDTDADKKVIIKKHEE